MSIVLKQRKSVSDPVHDTQQAVAEVVIQSPGDMELRDHYALPESFGKY
jgi:hypothetical protein